MSGKDRKLLKKIFNELKKLPALNNVELRFIESKRYFGFVTVDAKTKKKFIYLDRKQTFPSALYSLAHECAHVIANLHTHGPEFYLCERFTIDLIFYVYGRISGNVENSPILD